MARKNKQTAERRDEAAPQTTVEKARAAAAAGNVRLARKLLEGATEPEAAALRDQLAPDTRSLLTVGGVLLLIAFAAWAAILHAH